MAAEGLSLLGMVSQGEFNSIFVAQQATQAGVVIVKVLNHAAHGNEDAVQRLLNERALLETVSSRPHPFVVGFRFAMVDSTFAYIGMDNVGGGDLFSLLQRHGPFAPEAARMYVAEVALALAHLHSFDIVHRDVKPENVLIELDGHLKLADLGSAAMMLGRRGSMPPPPLTGILVGTPEYMPPEQILAEDACEDADVWSVACIACETMTGKTPFAAGDGKVETLVCSIVHHEIEPPHHDHIGPHEREFLLALLRREPTERLGSRAKGGALAIIEHEWFGGVSAREYLTKQIPPPWVPHLNGPATTVHPPTPELDAMAELALDPPLPSEQTPVVPYTIADFGEHVAVGIGSQAPAAAPVAVPAVSFSPSAAAAAEAAAAEDTTYWTDSEDDDHAPRTGAPSSNGVIKAAEEDESPDSITGLTAQQLERRREAPVASGFSSRPSAPNESPFSSSPSNSPNVSFRRTAVRW